MMTMAMGVYKLRYMERFGVARTKVAVFARFLFTFFLFSVKLLTV